MGEQHPSKSDKKRLILIDGYGFVFRAYHSMPPLTDASGTPVGAVFGFTNMLLKLLESHAADYIAVILDAGSKTFRNDIYSEYKANRPPAPEDLLPQFPLVRKAVEALSLPAIEMVGYEADDLIATYTRLAKEQGLSVRIVSSDKDLMQLVDDNVELYDPMKSRVIGKEQVHEKFGVSPDRVLDVLSLIGDASDNVPGVPGIGPKIAAELISRFGDLDTTLARAEEVTQKKRRENLIEFTDQAKLSRDLIRLESNVPIDYTLDDFSVKEPDAEALYRFAKKHNFKSVIAKVQSLIPEDVKNELSSDQGSLSFIDTPASSAEPKKEVTHKVATSIDAAKEILSTVAELSELGVYIGMTKKDAPYAMVLNANHELSIYLPIIAPQEEQSSLFDTPPSGLHSEGVTLAEAANWLSSLCQEAPEVNVISDDIKALSRLLYNGQIPFSSFDDISLMSYVLESGLHGHTLPDMAEKYLGEQKTDIVTHIPLKNIDADQAREHAQQAAELLLPLHSLLSQQLFDEHMVTAYQRQEKQLIAVLAQMEQSGITVDAKYLAGLSKDFTEKIAGSEKDIFKLAGKEFNIGSPKQLGEVLFDHMGITGGKKSRKTGAWSTNSEVLENLALEGHTIADHILQWRQLSKLKSTYTDALPKQIKQDGRIHTHFAMTITSTGRLSSYEPNLQNIPTRTEEGHKIRKAFICKPGYRLLSADYSQVELRLLAHIANIGTLKDAFHQGLDIHAATASQVFDVPLDKVTSELRRKAKTINFGIIYGMSAFGLAKRLGIPREEAAEYIDIYFKQYPGIRAYMEESKDYARKHGYVKTLWSRKCHIKGINDKNGAIRQFSERAAINAPLQGTAADIIKRAMIDIHHLCKKKSELELSMLLQVHDELVFEVPEKHAEKAAALIKKVMENAGHFSVPLEVELGIGQNWSDIH